MRKQAFIPHIFPDMHRVDVKCHVPVPGEPPPVESPMFAIFDHADEVVYLPQELCCFMIHFFCHFNSVIDDPEEFYDAF